jgi:hypothetical protein
MGYVKHYTMSGLTKRHWRMRSGPLCQDRCRIRYRLVSYRVEGTEVSER